MATSGSFNTTAYGSYNRCVNFFWTIKEQSTANNYTIISWTLKGAGGDSTTNFYWSAPFELTINGSIVYTSSTRIELKNGTVIATGETTIKHNADGTKTFTASCRAAIYSYDYNVSGSGSWELMSIPRQATLTAAPNFNDEGNPTITYSNMAGNNVNTLQACISLTKQQADIAYRDISKTGTSYTFNLTDAERNVLRNATTTANSRKVYFYVKTVIGSNTYYSYKEATLSIINAIPTLAATVTDTNSTITAITKNSNCLVKGLSNAQCRANAATKKGASISSIKIVNGSKTLTADGTFTGVEAATTTFTVTDTRGNTATQTVTNTFCNYVIPTLNMSATNVTTDGKTTLKVNGNYYNSYLGSTSNTLTVSYCVSANGGSYDAWKTITTTITNNTYAASINLTGFNYQNTYKIKGKIEDKLNSKTVIIDVVSKPVFEWGKDTFAINAHTTEGNIYGLEDLKSVPNNSNLNDMLEAGVYGVKGNANAETLTNCPSNLAGRLIVYSSGGTHLTNQYTYIIQEYHTYNNTYVYKRWIYKDTSGWHYDDWKRQNEVVNLWSGLSQMDGNTSITLKQKVSAQPHGVVLRFVAFNPDTGKSKDYHYHDFFISKDFVKNHSGAGHTFSIWGNAFNAACTKYLYMTDTTISGNAANINSGTATTGIVFNNKEYALCEVIGV